MFQLRQVSQFYFDHPTLAVSIPIDRHRIILQSAVDFNNPVKDWAREDLREELEGIQDVLSAYEEARIDEPNRAPSPRVPTLSANESAELEKEEALAGTPKKNQVEDPDRARLIMERGEPIPKPKPKPRTMHGKVGVGSDAGASQGQLAMPPNHQIVDRQYLTVSTIHGAELGRGSDDGQVRGSGVSGYVKRDGTYRLVFKDVALGVGIVTYQAIKEEPKEESKESPKEEVRE